MMQMPDVSDMALARKIAIRRGLGWTQAKVARDLKCSQQTVSRYQDEIRAAARRSGNVDEFVLEFLIVPLVSEQVARKIIGGGT